MENIILIGMPGCGKTTLGRMLAEKLGRRFVDADVYLEEREGRTIPELFAVSEDCFRDAEERAVKALSEMEGLVIATGGGVVKREGNIKNLKASGKIYFIDRSPEDIAGDVEVGTRPLLADGPAKVFTLYKERIALYRAAADVVVGNSGSLDEALRALEDLVVGGRVRG